MRKLILSILAMILFAFSVSAIEPTLNTNKIFLTPFYTNAMVAGTQYTYNVSTVTPDGISEIKSAIVTLDAWINPTRNVTIKVNGIPCNTPWYMITTTYASAGRGVFTFDCSNAILPMQTNQVNFTVIGGNIGASTAWLDLTYMNNPIGGLKVHGTEYVAGENGKMFLQFLDSEENAVNDSECFITIWYPNSTLFVNNSLMSYLDHGIYFKNFLVPSDVGVYPASAKCYRPLNFNNMVIPNAIWDGFETNTWTGGGNWSSCHGLPGCTDGWDVDPTLSTLVTNASVGCHAGNYCAKFTGSYGWIERGFPDVFVEGTAAYNISYSVKFSGFQTGETIDVFIFDGNWQLIRQINLAGGYTNNVWYNLSDIVSNTNYNLETVLLGFFTNSMPSTGDIAYIDSISIALIAENISITNETQYQVLRGSGEVHVSELLNNIVEEMQDVNKPGHGAYRIDSCSGFADGRCARTVDTNDSNWFEGELEDFLNITALESITHNGTGSSDEYFIEYDSPFTVDCTALFWIKEWNGSDWALFENYSTTSVPERENCHITINRNMHISSQYQYWFMFDNFMVWELDWSHAQMEAVKSKMDQLCADRNWTYEVPITNETVMPTDMVTKYCLEAFDDMYWTDLYYNESQAAEDNAGELTSYIHEMRAYIKSLYQRYHFVESGNNTALTADYYVGRVWSNANRNLTYYAPADVNYTAVGDSVWNYDGEIEPSLLSKIATAVWNFVARYTHGEILS